MVFSKLVSLTSLMIILTKMMVTPGEKQVTIARPAGRLSGLNTLVAGYLPEKANAHEQTFHNNAVGLVISGCGFFEYPQGQVRTVKAPFYFAVHPGRWARYGADAGTTWSERYLILTGARTKEWVHAGWLPPHGQVIPLDTPSAEAAASQHARIMDLVQSGLPSDTDLARLRVEEWLHHLYYRDIGTSVERSLRDRIRDQASSWESDLPLDTSLESCAQSLGVSYSHWRAIFRQTLGVSPYGYLLHLRVKHAAECLQQGSDSVKRTAFECGFQNVETFNRAFRQHTGMTPSEWRRKTR